MTDSDSILGKLTVFSCYLFPLFLAFAIFFCFVFNCCLIVAFFWGGFDDSKYGNTI